jgi:hypothetical protein
MANWHGTARSNHFRVKDEAAFMAWATALNLQTWTRPTTDTFAIAPFAYNDSEGGWPTTLPGTDEPANLILGLADHLKEGEVAILMEVGAEKQSYISGNATAVNCRGDVVAVELDDIYGLVADKMGIKSDSLTHVEG